jgi:hypothetical protein
MDSSDLIKNEFEMNQNEMLVTRRFSDDLVEIKKKRDRTNNFSIELRKTSIFNYSFSGTNANAINNISSNNNNNNTLETDLNNVFLAFERGIELKSNANKLFKENCYSDALKNYQEVTPF